MTRHDPFPVSPFTMRATSQKVYSPLPHVSPPPTVNCHNPAPTAAPPAATYVQPSFSIAVDSGQSRLHTVKEWKKYLTATSAHQSPSTSYASSSSQPPSPPPPAIPSPLHPHSQARIPSPTPPASNTRLALLAALQGPPSIIAHFFFHISHPSLHPPRMQTQQRRVCGTPEGWRSLRR